MERSKFKFNLTKSIIIYYCCTMEFEFLDRDNRVKYKFRKNEFQLKVISSMKNIILTK